jgi:hypothetical protein
MRSVSKSVLLAVAALALSGLTAAAASAETAPEWLLNGASVTTSTPVTDTATEFVIHRQEEGRGAEDEEVVNCTLSGKGTVNAKGAGTITAWNETSCRGVGRSEFECEAGTVSASGAKLPWTTQLVLTTERSDVNNEVKGFELTWQCQAKWLGIGPKLYKVTCYDGFVSNWLETNEKGQLGEEWNFDPSAELHCVRTWGSENRGSGAATVRRNFTLLKGEKGTLSYRK